MSKLQLDLNVKTQEALVKAFATALESVANSSDSATRGNENLSQAIQKSSGKTTAAIFSFNMWTTAISTTVSAFKKIFSAIDEMSDKLHEQELQIIRYNNRWGEGGYEKFTQIRKQFVDMGYSIETATAALEVLGGNQSGSKNAENIGIAALNTARRFSIAESEVVSFVDSFSQIVDVQGRFRPDKFKGIVDKLDLKDQEIFLKMFGMNLQQFKQYGISATLTWDKFSKTIRDETSGMAKAVAAEDPSSQIERINLSLDTLKEKFSAALLTPKGENGKSSMEVIADAVTKFVSNEKNINAMTGAMTAFGEALPGILQVITPIAEALTTVFEKYAKFVKFMSDHPNFAKIGLATAGGGLFGGVAQTIKLAIDDRSDAATIDSRTDAAKVSREVIEAQIKEYEAKIAASNMSSETKTKELDEIIIASNKQAEVKQLGKFFDEGYAEGIENNIEIIRTAAAHAGEAANDGIKTSTQTKSPSRIAMGLGGYYSIGYGLGIENNIDSVRNAAQNLGEAAINNTTVNNNTSTKTTSVASPNITIQVADSSMIQNVQSELNAWWETIQARQNYSGI